MVASRRRAAAKTQRLDSEMIWLLPACLVYTLARQLFPHLWRAACSISRHRWHTAKRLQLYTASTQLFQPTTLGKPSCPKMVKINRLACTCRTWNLYLLTGCVPVSSRLLCGTAVQTRHAPATNSLPMRSKKAPASFPCTPWSSGGGR